MLRHDGQSRGELAGGDDDEVGDAGVVEAVARRAADGVGNCDRRVRRAEAREREPARVGKIRRVFGRDEIARINPHALVVILNRHRRKRRIRGAVIRSLGQRNNHGLVALDQRVIHGGDRHDGVRLADRNRHAVRDGRVVHAVAGRAADGKQNGQRVRHRAAARE